MKTHLLWDLDGTLTDPQLGILTCIRYAMTKFGHPIDESVDLRWCIGPPLHETFEVLAPHASPKQVLDLVSFYRERFSVTGLFENSVFPEVPLLLSDTKSSGRRNFLATSKPHVFAHRILEHFDIHTHFDAVHGSELSGERADKGELILHVLEIERIPPSRALMIGDRKHDVLGAKKAGIDCVGVCWGYGSREELETAGAHHVFDDPRGLRQYLLGQPRNR